MKQPKSDQPQAVATLVSIIETALQARGDVKPRLTLLAQLASRAGPLLKFSNIEERTDAENAAVIAVAKKFGLVG